MIQRRHGIVWVRQADGTTAPFDPSRLTDSIDGAAALAGHHELALGESLAAAVEMFALRITPQTVVSADDIAKLEGRPSEDRDAWRTLEKLDKSGNMRYNQFIKQRKVRP